MEVKRFVWIVVIALFVMIAFVGGFALGTYNSMRAQYAGAYGFGSGFGARGMGPSGVITPTVPFTRTFPFGFAPGSRMMPGYGMGPGMMPRFGPGSRMQPRLAPRGQVPPQYAPRGLMQPRFNWRGRTQRGWRGYGMMPAPGTPAPAPRRGR
jgi:hypothetical protein